MAYRELKEGGRLESQRWGRDEAVQRGQIAALTCLAFNTAQVCPSQAVRSWRHAASVAYVVCIRRKLGAAHALIYIGRSNAELPLEELRAVLGHPATASLRSLDQPVRPP